MERGDDVAGAVAIHGKAVDVVAMAVGGGQDVKLALRLAGDILAHSL
jgi:hypothetical protein